jgi:hypothetical protein
VQMDDMILVSIDDHMIEPPDMYKNHVPAKWQDAVPKVVKNANGVDEWHFQGSATSTPFGMAATVGWPREEWGFNPGSYSELRPGCFDVHERVRDMNANGVLAQMNFPTMAGFNARTFTEAEDKEIALVMLRGYNDWAIDEWAAAYPGRFIPQGIVPMWDLANVASQTVRKQRTWRHRPLATACMPAMTAPPGPGTSPPPTIQVGWSRSASSTAVVPPSLMPTPVTPPG